MDMGAVIGLCAVVLGISMPVFVVGIIFFFKSRDRAEMQKTVRAAIEKGETLPAEFLDSLQKAHPRAKTPMNDVRNGIILMAVAGGLMLWNYLDHNEIGGHLSGIAAVPGLIGVALLILGIIGLIGNRKS